jgi:hypothetical protein
MTRKECCYIWCPKKNGLTRKNPRACRVNCRQRNRCRAYLKYWQPDLFDVFEGGCPEPAGQRMEP